MAVRSISSPLTKHFVARHVDRQLAELEHFALRLGIGVHAAQQRAGARNQLAGAERLDKVVVGAQLKADDAVFDLALGGQHDDRHIGVVADGATYALARDAGKHQVKDDQIEMVLRKLFQGLLAVSDSCDPVVLTLEVSRHRIADSLLVLDQ